MSDDRRFRELCSEPAKGSLADDALDVMTLTWVAIIASLLMGAAAALVFIYAVKQDYFRDIEEIKYQVFWSDIDEVVNEVEEKNKNERAQ
mgnify:CR=1 FL=1